MEEAASLERIQKSALRLINNVNQNQTKHVPYNDLLTSSGMPSLAQRRHKLSISFADKCVKNPKTQFMFPENEIRRTRHPEKFKVAYSNHNRLSKSSIPTMVNHLNKKYS